MIAIDTSVIVAVALREPEAEGFQALLGRQDAIIGWPTLLETRMVLMAKGFVNAAAIIDQLASLPNVTATTFDEKHYRAAENAFDRFGKGRHPASLNMGDCFSYAVASLARVPLLFKGQDFGKTDVACHPAAVGS